ncbi:MAG TPA: hypothetical protein VMT76_01985 [Puia sp.]|nr:hypothetical protein [Puia sp.]
MILYCMVIISCGNSSGAAANSTSTENDKTANTTTSANSSNGDKGTITCSIDGVSKTFKVAQSFFEISLGVDPNGPKDGIEVLDGDIKKEGFQFEFKKSGTTKIKSDASGDLNCIINYYNPQGATYTANDATITVTSYSQNHITGTFAGKFNRYNGGNANPQHIEITDGKFDLQRR